MLPLLKVAELREYRGQPHPSRVAGRGAQRLAGPASRQAAASRAVAAGSVLRAERHREVHRGAGLLAGAQRRAEPGGGCPGRNSKPPRRVNSRSSSRSLLGQLGGDQLGRGQPGGDACPLRDPEQGGLHLVGGQLPRVVRPVQRGRVPGEPALPVGQPAVQRRRCPGRPRGPPGQASRRGPRRSAAGRGRPRGCRAPGRRGRRRTAGRAPRRSRRASPRRTAPSCRGPPSPRSGWRSSGTCRCRAGRG